MGGPTGPQFRGGSFAPPANIFSGFTPPSRPNVGWSPSLPGPGPRGWTPPVVNRGWDRPPANRIADQSTKFHPGNAINNDNRQRYGIGDHEWNRHLADHGSDRYRSDYGWLGNYSDNSYYPYYSNYPYNSDDSSSSGSTSFDSSTYQSYPYGSYANGNSYQSSGSQTDSGASGTSSQPASASTAPRNESAAYTDEEIWVVVKQRMDVARRAFEKGDYSEAQRECDQAIKLLPANTNLQEFRALCQFAQSDYKDADATLHEVLAGGPGWDWKTLSSFYTDAETYTKQLRALERYVRENPKDAAGRFVLAYHDLVLDSPNVAVDHLQEVVKLQPKDTLSATIVEALKKVNSGKPMKAS